MAKNNIEFTDRNASRTGNIQGRKEEWVPAVVYGPKQESKNIFVRNKFFVMNGTKEDNTIYTLDGESNLKGTQVMIKSVQKNPTINQVLHVDFYAPNMLETVKVEVEFDFQGEPVGIEEGGVIQTTRRSIEIECLPTEIPESIPVDISGLKINDSIKMGDIKVDEKFKVISAPEYAVISVVEMQAEEVDEPVAAAEGAEAAAPAEGDAPAAEGDKKAE